MAFIALKNGAARRDSGVFSNENNFSALMSLLTFTVLIQFLAVLAIGWLVGERFDNAPHTIAIAAFLFVFWLVWQHRRFERWLDDTDGSTRMGYGGLWTHISDLVAKRIRGMRYEQRLLQEDVEFFKDSFQAISSAVVFLDRERKIAWCNKRAEPLLGIHPRRDQGQMLAGLFRAPEFIDYLESNSYVKPLVIPSPVNPLLTIEVQATTYRSDDILIFARDVSDVVQLERMRQDFIANVSHEMRTPLTVITGYLDTLKMSADSLPPVWTETLDKMLAQSQSMDNMVSDLIWLARLESVPARRDLTLVNINQLLATIVADARVTAPQKKFFLLIGERHKENEFALEQTDKYKEQFAVHGLYDELRSAFNNLVQNAIKYTHDKGEIIINCYKQSGELRLSVRDNGIGIDSVHIPRLTERFYRADASRNSEAGGTGLGLAIVKHILVRHQGRLEISSKLGTGSQFTCVFPAKRLGEIDQSKTAS